MLVVFFELGVAAGSILGGLGRVLDASKPHLSMNVDVSKHASQKCSSCNKTTVFAMFYRLRNMPHTATEHVFCIAFKAFLDMVQGLLQEIPAGIHFLLFITTLQRGGTCAAHGMQWGLTRLALQAARWIPCVHSTRTAALQGVKGNPSECQEGFHAAIHAPCPKKL